MTPAAEPLASAHPLRRLEPADAEAGAALSAAAGWGHSVEDWRCRLSFGSGIGCERDGRLAAAGVLFPGPRPVAFFGMLLVDPSLRGRGVGAAITEAAARAAKAVGQSTVALFAVPRAAPLYDRLGFRKIGEMASFRRDADVGSRAGSAHAQASGIRPLDRGDLPSVLALDLEVYGADRSPLLLDQIERFPGSALVASDASGCRGYVLAVARMEQTVVGPIVARDSGTAIALMGKLLSRTSGSIRCDSLALEDEDRTAFHRWLEDEGFVALNRLPLMIRGRLDEPMPFARPRDLYAAQSAAAG